MARTTRWAALVALGGIAVTGCGPSTPVTTVTQAPSAAAAPSTPAAGSTSPTATSPATAAPVASPSAAPTTPNGAATTAPTGTSGSPAAGALARPSRGGVEFAPTGAGALSGHRVLVDPGHNGVYDARIDEALVPDGRGGRKACNTSGTANAKTSEHELNWAVGQLLVADLRARGATVWVTRPDDRGVGPCVDERAAIGNRVGADLVVSLHADGNESPTARGFHVITSAAMTGGPEAERQSQRLAGLVRDGMVAAGMPVSTYLGHRGIDVRADIAGVNLSEPPAIMLEMGNMHHPADAALLARPAFRAKVATAVADAVTSALG